VVLLGCSTAARRFLAEEPLLKDAYLVQGLVLVTMGFIAYFSGLKLALVIAAESVLLTVLAQQRNNILLRGGAVLTAVLSGAWVVQFGTGAWRDVFLGTSIILVMLFNGWWEHRHSEGSEPASVRQHSGFFMCLAVALTATITWHAVLPEWRAVAWTVEALLLTAAFHLLRTPPLPIFAQGLAVLAQGWWFFAFALKQPRPNWIVPATF